MKFRVDMGCQKEELGHVKGKMKAEKKVFF